MQRDHFLSRVESLQKRLGQVRQRIRMAERQPATAVSLDDLKTALEEMTTLEQQLVEQNKELAEGRELAEEEKGRYRDLFDQTPEAYLVTDRRGVIVEANQAAAALLQRPKESFIGTSFGIYVARENFKDFLLDASVTLRKRGSQFETRLHRRPADPIRVSVTLSTSGNEAPLRWLIRDITARVESDERLRSSERLATMSATALLLAREISNPLNGIFTTVQRLERDLNRQKNHLGEPVRSTLQDLTQEISRLRGLLQKLRSFSRPLHFNLDAVDLRAMLVKIAPEEAGACAARGIEIQVEESLPPGLAVKADYERLKQAFVNLCRNAVEAMPHGGKLTVTGSRSDDRIDLEFIDTGIGVPGDIDVFDLFTTTKFQAMGMGLPIARQIIADHGGKIGYESVPGKSVFHVILPVEPPHTANIHA
ncbi:MAG: two-component system sensor histidine kinase NtrB [Candidatus Binatia bacterium]